MSSDWVLDQEVDNYRVLRKKKFNKELFCKRNKLGGGKYGPHRYNNSRCIACGKIDPQVKKDKFNEERAL